jgi:TPR repeat protein
MNRTRFARIAAAGAGALLVLILLAAPRAAAAAFSSGLDSVSLGVWDAPSRYFPGHYFEQKAQFYLKKKDYAEALRLFELSGYWADKVSQYNAGIMHFNGIGVPVDKARGTAWLGIAAESHDSLAEAALQAAYAELTPAERAQADTIFRTLDAKYGDAVALPRALRQYAFDARQSIFGFGVTGPGSVATVGGGRGLEENSVDFVHRMDAQRDALIAQITGHVTVGAVRPLDVAPEARRNASSKVLAPAPAGHP